MKNWFKSHHKQVKQLLIALLVGIAVSGIFFLIFSLTGVFQFDGGLHINHELFNALKNSIWLYIVFVLVEALTCTLCVMNPIGSGAFIALGIVLFGANWKCFLACFIGCWLAYLLIDAVGRFGGSKLIIKIFGEEEYKKIEDLVNEKGLVYVPIMYVLPLFPDDFICLVVGSLKMKWWYHMLSGAIGKSIGIATAVFGISIIPRDLFIPFSVDKLYNYFVLGAVLIVYITFLFKISRWIDKKLSAHIKKKREEKN